MEFSEWLRFFREGPGYLFVLGLIVVLITVGVWKAVKTPRSTRKKIWVGMRKNLHILLPVVPIVIGVFLVGSVILLDIFSSFRVVAKWDSLSPDEVEKIKVMPVKRLLAKPNFRKSFGLQDREKITAFFKALKNVQKWKKVGGSCRNGFLFRFKLKDQNTYSKYKLYYF